MSQSNLSRFYQKRQKRNSELLSKIISGRSKYVKIKKNSSEASANFEENSRSASVFEINEQRAESPRFEALEPVIIIKTRAESPAVTAPRFERIELAATSPAATSPAAVTSPAAISSAIVFIVYVNSKVDPIGYFCPDLLCYPDFGLEGSHGQQQQQKQQHQGPQAKGGEPK
ncbi:hypothetical protein Glove_23g35 [Diversispora epigaea]|uniref:Uncharacterized protein n=1 Tax=Diversispora epigaea TaxID=1348612 RepID=A0A397JT16_9GLOM|nr:hypothetical protein Glove_23g35 [Diversispora epigaea]